jgi:hypothetical protein
MIYLLLVHGGATKCAHAICNRIIQAKVTEPKATSGCNVQFRKIDDFKDIQKQKQIKKSGYIPVENRVRSSSPQALATQKEIQSSDSN